MSDDDLLQPQLVATDPARREALLERTARLVRWRRQQRVALRLGAGVLCFAAGLATAWLRPTPVREVVVWHDAPESNALATRAEASRTPVALSPADLELQAEATFAKAESARLFRAAGDAYLREYADYESALRCYRNFLHEASAADLSIAADDTWLLTSLKRAREQEVNP